MLRTSLKDQERFTEIQKAETFPKKSMKLTIDSLTKRCKKSSVLVVLLQKQVHIIY